MSPRISRTTTLCAHTTAGSLGVVSSIFTTSMGIREGAARVCDEVTVHLMRNAAVTHISLIGTSLGGLYCRAAAPAIHERHPHLVFVNLVTFASPLLGVRNHLAWLLQVAVNIGGAGSTGRELMLADRSGEGGMPLVAWMAHPASPYAAALARFSNVVFITNAVGDDKVPFHSARVSAAEGGPSVGSAVSLTDVGVPARELDQYSHVTAVYRSGGSSSSVASAAAAADADAVVAPAASGCTSALTAAGGAGVMATAAPAAAGIIGPSAAALLAAEPAPVAGSEPGALERWMAAQIRGTLARAAPPCIVTTVECTFTEWPAALVNHLRIAVSKPWLTGELGKEVPRLVARHLFVYPPTPGAGAAAAAVTASATPADATAAAAGALPLPVPLLPPSESVPLVAAARSSDVQRTLDPRSP